MEGDYGIKSLEKENESLKQTVYRLSVDLNTQKQTYEEEINYFKTLIEKHLKNLTTIEKTKQDLQSRIKYLNGQLVDCHEEIERKDQEILKLKGIIDQQKAYISHTETLRNQEQQEQEHNKEQIDKEVQEVQKANENLQTTVANLVSLTEQLSTQITAQDTQIKENMTVIDKLKQVVEAQVQQQLNHLSVQDETKKEQCSTNKENEKYLSRMKDNLSKLTTKVDSLTEEQVKLNENVHALTEKQLVQSNEIETVRNAQNDFLKIWLS